MIHLGVFLLGMIVMDFMWAWRLGLAQALWQRLTSKGGHNE